MKSHVDVPDDIGTTDEDDQICPICDKGITNPNWKICESCNIRCHNKCMNEKNDIYTCTACIIMLELEQEISYNVKTPNIPGGAEVTQPKPTPKTRLKLLNINPTPQPRPMRPASAQDTAENTTRIKLNE